MHRIACHECDLVLAVPEAHAPATVSCVRCGSVLFRSKVDSIHRTLAWTIAGLVLYVVAVCFPFLAMKSGAIVQQTSLLTGIQRLYGQEEFFLTALVLMTCILIPLFQMLGLLYIFVALKSNIACKHGLLIFRLLQHVKPWSMMEIYMLGILVSIVKLGKMATIVPGLAVIAFGLLIFVFGFALASVDSHMVWERLERVSRGDES